MHKEIIGPVFLERVFRYASRYIDVLDRYMDPTQGLRIRKGRMLVLKVLGL